MVTRKNLLALLGVGVSAFVLSAAGALAADKKLDQHIENLSKAATAAAAGSADPAALASERARREAAEKMVAQLQAQNLDSDRRMAELQQQLSQASTSKQKSGADAAEVKKYQDQIAQLNEQIGQQQAARAQADAQLIKLQQQLASMPNTMEMQQQADIERARREAAERAMVELQSSNRGRDQQMTQLQQQLAAANAKAQAVPAADPQAAVEKARRESTEAALQKTQGQMSAADAENIRLAKQNAALEQQMAQLKAAASSNQMSQAAGQLAALEQRNAELMAQLSAARTQNEAAAKASVMTSSNDAATNARIAEMGQKAAADRAEYQALLEAEKSRRQKLEAMLAQGTGSDDAGKVQAMAQQIADLNTRNAQLENRLKAEGAAAAASAAGAGAAKSDNAQLATKIADATMAADAQKMAQLQKQLDALKSDNQMLSQRLAARPADMPVAAAPAPAAPSGDVELVSALESAKAERDEYRNLLQRERLAKREGSAGTDASMNERIAKLEVERADLVKRLEFEKSKNESAGVPSGGQPEGVVKELQDKLAAATAERDKLQKQLKVTQEDVIAARTQQASAPQAAGAVPASDVSALVAENRRLQTELAQGTGKAATADAAALQGEVASLRAQNAVLSSEISKRIAAAPDRAAMNNAAAEANYKVAQAQAAVAADVQQAQTRFNAAEAENIRLARELAATRSRLAAAATPAAVQAAPVPAMQAQPQYQPAVMQAGQVSNPPQAAPAAAPLVVTAMNTAPQPAAVAAVQPVMAQPVMAQTPQPAMQQPVMQQPVMQQPVMQQVAYGPAVNVGPTGADISGYLRRAGIPMVSGFEKVSRVSGPQFGAFRWDTGTVFGTAEQAVMPSDSGFEEAVTAYLTKTRQRCTGTFDQSFDSGQFARHRNFAVADVACVMPDGTGAGAAMVFFYKDGMFNVVAHEGDVTQFDQAMTTRDAFARFMQGVL